jgi:hypothetical protein
MGTNGPPPDGYLHDPILPPAACVCPSWGAAADLDDAAPRCIRCGKHARRDILEGQLERAVALHVGRNVG